MFLNLHFYIVLLLLTMEVFYIYHNGLKVGLMNSHGVLVSGLFDMQVGPLFFIFSFSAFAI